MGNLCYIMLFIQGSLNYPIFGWNSIKLTMQIYGKISGISPKNSALFGLVMIHVKGGSLLLLMVQKSFFHQLRLVVYPIIYGFFYTGGAGFQPLTVSL